MKSLRSVILIGFGTFGRYAANSGEQAIKAITKQHIPSILIKDREIFPATIPDYDRGAAVLELARMKEADAVVCLGMASDRVALCVETRTKNLIDNIRYCPELSGQPVDPSLPIGTEFDLELRQWNYGEFTSACVDECLPRPRWSLNAGGFCCNHLMFQLFAATKRCPEFRSIPWIFLHIPCSEEAIRPEDLASFRAAGKSSMKIDDIVKCLEIFLRTALPSSKHETVTT